MYCSSVGQEFLRDPDKNHRFRKLENSSAENNLQDSRRLSYFKEVWKVFTPLTSFPN